MLTGIALIPTQGATGAAVAVSASVVVTNLLLWRPSGGNSIFTLLDLVRSFALFSRPERGCLRAACGASVDNRAMDTTGKTKVLYIAGTSRCGSTILGNVLGQIRGFVSVGEISSIWERGFLENAYCGCGTRFLDCPMWMSRAYRGGIRCPAECGRRAFKSDLPVLHEDVTVPRAGWRVVGRLWMIPGCGNTCHA